MEYLIDGIGAQAAIRAGYSEKGARQQASRLLANVDVQAEIERLRVEQRARLDISMERVTRQLQEDRALAHRNGQAGAAVSADMGLAKLHGLVVDKTEITRRTEDMTDEEMEAELKDLRAQIAEAEEDEAAKKSKANGGDPETRH